MKTRFSTPYLFILPALVIYALFVLVPIAGSARMSLFEWGGSPLPRFVAFKNYALLLKDTIFWRALMNNALVLVGSLVIQLPFSALLALLLSYKTFFRTLFRTAFFAPMVMPTVAIAILWQYIYAPEDGLVTKLIQLVTGGDFTFPWLATPSTSPFLPSVSLLCIFVTICWQYTGFHMVLYMAGIAAIPDELYEAARIDGANELQICRHIVLPALKPTIVVSATLSVIGSLKYFDLIYLMAAGLPQNDREVMATYIYRLAFDQGQGRFGYGSAAAILLIIIALAVVLPIQASRMRKA
ncbi:MAG: sugar ABC transporter permease [Victivallales bacterium]|nr:sugar ABC transporter permease [Victivallales bacterium]